VFDDNYYKKGLVMIQSLLEVMPDAFIYILNPGDTNYKIQNENVKIFNWSEIANEELKRAKSNRTHQEFCWTCASWFMNFLLQKYDIPMLTYLDADIMFFNSPEIIFQEIGIKDIAIVPHRFATEELQKRLEVNGKFNVSWITIRNSPIGHKCIQRWSKQCLEWCYYRIEGNKMADQKYLDEWPELYGNNLCIIQNIGVNVAPWNVGKYTIILRDHKIYIEEIIWDKEGMGVLNNSQLLIFYHYHEFKDENFLTGYSISDNVRKIIYEPYIKKIKEVK
jgi:hypothetical protein